MTGCRRALFALDPKNADGRLFFILQLSKVLQGEPEKVSRCFRFCLDGGILSGRAGGAVFYFAAQQRFTGGSSEGESMF